MLYQNREVLLKGKAQYSPFYTENIIYSFLLNKLL